MMKVSGVYGGDATKRLVSEAVKIKHTIDRKSAAKYDCHALLCRDVCSRGVAAMWTGKSQQHPMSAVPVMFSLFPSLSDKALCAQKADIYTKKIVSTISVKLWTYDDIGACSMSSGPEDLQECQPIMSSQFVQPSTFDKSIPNIKFILIQKKTCTTPSCSGEIPA